MRFAVIPPDTARQLERQSLPVRWLLPLLLKLTTGTILILSIHGAAFAEHSSVNVRRET